MNQMKQPKATQKGFTLIELIMVIVILGILSAFALPKFADFSDDASSASIQAALGAIKSGSAIAHAQWLADGSPSTGTIEVVLEGSTITMTTDGYPSEDDLNDLLDLSSYAVNTGPATLTIISLSAEVGSPCFSYEDSTNPPTISVIAAVAVAGTGATSTCTP